jgi:hypothetical protein
MESELMDIASQRGLWWGSLLGRMVTGGDTISQIALWTNYKQSVTFSWRIFSLFEIYQNFWNIMKKFENDDY